MRQYPDYVQIELPWINRIPSHWRITKNKCIFDESKDLVGEFSDRYTLLWVATMN